MESSLISWLGRGLLPVFGYSIPKLVTTLYPLHSWQVWKFSKTPANYWQQLRQKLAIGDQESRQIAESYLTELGQVHNVQSFNDWYRLSTQLIGDGTMFTLELLGGLPWLLTKVYPEHNWEEWRFGQLSKKAVQRYSKETLAKLFPTESTRI